MAFLKNLFSGNKSNELLDEAKKFVDSKEYQSAIATLDSVLLTEKENLVAYYYRGFAYFCLNKWNEAIVDFSRVVGTKESFAQQARYYRASSYFELQNYPGAHQDLYDLLRIDGSNQKALLLMCETQQKAGDTISALEYTGKYIAQFPNEAKGYILKGNLLLLSDDKKTALPEFSRALEIHPNHYEALIGRGRAEMDIGKLDLANEDFIKATEINPHAFDAYHLSATILYRKKLFEEALKQVLTCLEVRKDYFETKLLQANIYIAMQKPKDALGVLEKLIIQDSKNAELYLLQGKSYRMLNAVSDAKHSFDTALKISQHSPDIYKSLAVTEAQFGNYNGAIEYLTKSIELNPNDDDAFFKRGKLYQRMNEKFKAIQDIVKASQIDPSNANYYYYSGMAREKVDDNSGAIADYSKAQLKSDFYEPVIARAKLRMKINEYNAAVIDFDKASQMKPEHPLPYYFKAICYRYMQKLDKALGEINKAIQLDPEYADAYYIRALVSKEQHLLRQALDDVKTAVRLGTKNFAGPAQALNEELSKKFNTKF